jgi:hypothetical protein
VLGKANIGSGSSAPTSTAQVGIETTPGLIGGNGGPATHSDGGGQLLQMSELDASMFELCVPDTIHANHHRLQGAQERVLRPWASMLRHPMMYPRHPLTSPTGPDGAMV